MNTIKCLVAALAVALFTVSCEETDYMKFDTSHNGTYFLKDSMTYSFGVTPIEVKTHVMQIPVKIMGTVSHTESRQIGYELVRYSNLTNDSVPAVENEHFRIVKAVVEPDSITGYIEIEIFRDALEGSNSEGYKRYRLGLNLVKNENFEPTLTKEQNSLILTFDNAVDRPEWLNAFGDRVFPDYLYGKWHPYKLIKLVEFYHKIADVQPETYKKMVEMYGENMEHIHFGDPYEYSTTYRKYVLKPTYDFLNDPANYEMIISEYPDFPFDSNGKSDFPNPYASNVF